MASLLSLEISRAFDNVFHQRLTHTMSAKGIPKWFTKFVEFSLADRTSAIKLRSYIGQQITTYRETPQGSLIPLLLFASLLHSQILTPKSSSVGILNDTEVQTWSDTTEQGIRVLEVLYRICEDLTEKYGGQVFSREVPTSTLSKHDKKTPSISQNLSI